MSRTKRNSNLILLVVILVVVLGTALAASFGKISTGMTLGPGILLAVGLLLFMARRWRKDENDG